MKKKQTKKKTTIDWLDVDNYYDGTIILKNGKHKTFTRGVKINPCNLMIVSDSEQRRYMNSLRLVYNKLDFSTYQAFVAKPVDLTVHMYHLMRLEENEPNDALKRLIQEDIMKAKHFIEYMQEIDFLMFVQDDNEDEVHRKSNVLLNEIRGANLEATFVSDEDIKHYINFQFENEAINDLYYSRAYLGI